MKFAVVRVGICELLQGSIEVPMNLIEDVREWGYIKIVILIVDLGIYFFMDYFKYCFFCGF